MVLELAKLTIKPGTDEAFLAAIEEAEPLFLRAKGCSAMRVRKSVETPDCYYLMVEWDTLEDHMVTFRNSADFTRWRELAGPHFAAPPVVEHLE